MFFFTCLIIQQVLLVPSGSSMLGTWKRGKQGMGQRYTLIGYIWMADVPVDGCWDRTLVLRVGCDPKRTFKNV